LLAIFAPSRAFLMLYGVAVAGLFFVWRVILVTHVAFRRALEPNCVAKLPMRLRFYPNSTILGITALPLLWESLSARSSCTDCNTQFPLFFHFSCLSPSRIGGFVGKEALPGAEVQNN
jgi:L-asparagine transporter-like permease